MNNYDLEVIGKFLAERRKHSGYTQSQLAELINTSFKTVSSWENGHSFPDLTYQLDLCKYLKITLEELHTGKLNNKKRRTFRIVHIAICVLLFIFVLFLPAFIYLFNYYHKSYGSFNVYNLEVYDDKELILRGSFIEYYKYNTLIISDVFNNKDNSQISLQIYCNDSLIYQTSVINYISVSIDKYYKHTDNWTYKILNNNKVIKSGSIKFIKHNDIDVKKEDIDNIINKQDTILNNLKKNGFKDGGNGTYTKVINKNERLEYYALEYKLCYYYQDNTISKNIEYDIVTNKIFSIIYYKYSNNNLLIERFYYNYDNNKLDCFSNECPSSANVIDNMKKHISLLGLE